MVYPLLSKRLLFVSGKGGVGKSTIALSLALLAADQGRRTLLVEIDTTGVVAEKFGKEAAPLGQELELKAGLWSMVVEGRSALDEYLRMILPRIVVKAVLRSKVYNYFVAGAPGLKELMCMGKIFYEVVDRKKGGRPVWDLVIVDAPATGHGIQYFRMPRAANETFTMGLVHRETQRVMDLLRDPERTAHVLVTLAEDLPVSETLELFRVIHDEMEFPTGPIVINCFHSDVLAPATPDELKTFAKSIGEHDELLLDLLEKTRNFQERHTRNIRNARRLKKHTRQHSLLVLPALFQERLGPEEIKPLIRTIDEQLSGNRELPPVQPVPVPTEALA